MRQGYYSRCLAETACLGIGNNSSSGPKMKFAWGPTCGNYWKRISSDDRETDNSESVLEIVGHSTVYLELQQYLFWF